ncbi:hypothetical protein [Nocardioides sp.]|uniref:hypothetical protein n=1 Tax=Nocardioides sp. TaxID=35761 RepID=UPI0039E61F3F
MALIPTPKRVLGTVRGVAATGLGAAQAIVARPAGGAPKIETPTIGSNPKRRHTSKASRALAR